MIFLICRDEVEIRLRNGTNETGSEDIRLQAAG
jgi:hypothetical protein